MERKAKIIAFSGIDGSGKSTQLSLLYEKLNEDYKVYIAKLSYMPLDKFNKGKLSNLLIEARSVLEILKQYETLFKVKANEYDYILCDRFTMCYLAYAYAFGIKDMDLLKRLLILGKNPDLTLYFDVDVQTAVERINAREKQTLKHENYDTLTKVSKGYHYLYPDITNLEIIDANKEEGEVTREVDTILRTRKIIKK